MISSDLTFHRFMVFFINMRAQRKYAIFLAMRPLLVLLIIFTQKTLLTILNVEK